MSINTHTSRLERFNMHLDRGWYGHEDVKCCMSKDNRTHLSELTSAKFEQMFGLVRYFSELDQIDYGGKYTSAPPAS